MTIPLGDTRILRNRENETREARLADANSGGTKANKPSPIVEEVLKKLDDGLNWTNIGA